MSEFAALVGWDWADREHEIHLREVGSETSEESQIGGSAEQIHEWAAQMQSRFAGRKIGVCIETSRGAVIWALMNYEHIVLYPVNPKSAAGFRESLYPSGKKDDPVDAGVLLEMIVKHRDKLRPFAPADEETRSLGMLSEFRRKLVGQRVDTTNALRSNLKSYFPQALELAGELDTDLACDFLERWASLSELQRAKSQTLRTFYTKHRCRSREKIDERVALASRALALTQDRAVLHCGALTTRSLVHLIRTLLEEIDRVDAAIAEIYLNHGEYELIDSMPGIGPVLGPRLIAILGSDRSRFESREELQCLSGAAPITSRSGGRNGTITVHRRLKRSKFIHQTVVEWANCAMKGGSVWAKAFYEDQRAKGKGRYVALRALAYKLLRILYHCWKTRTRYSEEAHQQSLVRRGSPLAAKLV